ncbi:shikimate dehydrogenase family protein [Derxia gummosa]|uniref:Shikimate dehydrogenase family protein n=1 Tax=Derxia gummosa DSM 723 TaxID=1121388 RepID=A0A8B6X8E9_9BURK|nr:shikimate dehydrogenase [Derxia gummosa]
MQHPLSGATRLYLIVGDPIAQVKSPAGVTDALQQRGHDAVCVPWHVAPADFDACLRATGLARNVDGVIVTVPHKFAATGLCATLSERARFLGATNVMRRNADGTWHGDMVDGLGFTEAMADAGCQPEGRRVLLVGAGGAGSAIAHAQLMGDASLLAIHDEDAARRGSLIARLAALGRGEVVAGSDDPTGFDIVINATPMGMREGDQLPVRTELFTPEMFVGDVITVPLVTPMIAAARAKACRTSLGTEMFGRVRDLMVDFLLGGEVAK